VVEEGETGRETVLLAGCPHGKPDAVRVVGLEDQALNRHGCRRFEGEAVAVQVAQNLMS